MKIFIKRLILMFIIFPTILFLLLFFSCKIPRKYIKKNVIESINVMEKQGEKIHKNSLGRKTRQDNDTDAIMINIAYSIDTKNVTESIMFARRNYNPNITTKVEPEKKGDLNFYGKKFNMTKELDDTVKEKEITSFSYGKYWHGYLIIIRPLLLFFSIKGIRIFLVLASLILLTLLSYRIYKKTNILYATSIFISYIAFDFLLWFDILQGIFVILLSLIFGIIVSYKQMSKKTFNIFLFIAGGLVSFFDFLTFPLVGMLMPILINNIFYEKETKKKILIKELIINILFVTLGYIYIWLLKWIMSDILYGTNIIKISITEILYRTGLFKNYNELCSVIVPNGLIIKSLFFNITYSYNYINVLVKILFFITIFRNIVKKQFLKSISENIIPIILSILVIMWYIVISQHSWYHFHFTYKNLIIINIMELLYISKYILNTKKQHNMLK